MKKEDLITNLNLQPHPEGGYYAETYRSKNIIPQDVLAEKFNGDRNYATGIYFLLTHKAFSAFHKVNQDEMWHFYAGDAITLHQIDPDGNYQKVLIGNNLAQGEVFQYTVPGGSWFASEVTKPDGFALAGCTVWPGFDFADFTLADKKALIQQFPNHKETIDRLTR